jgi:transposase
LNRAIAEKLQDMNSRKFQKMDGTRRSLYETIDRPALRPLPSSPYEYAEWKKARVNIDYHIEIDGHYYSVPYQLVKEQVEVRFTATTIEVLFKNRRVATHPRSYKRGAHTTLSEHMPKAHKKYLEWTPSRIMDWAGKNGPNTRHLTSCIMDNRKTSGAGFPLLSGYHEAGKTVLVRAGRGRLLPCPASESLQLQERRIDPENQS